MNNDDILSLPRLTASIKRELRLILICTLSFAVLATLYCIITPAKYTADTSIMLDPAQAATVAELSSKAGSRFEDGSIVSQLELMKSRRVAQKAMEYLPANDELSKVNKTSVIDEEVLEEIGKGLHVFREGESYVITITYTSTDPQVSAGRANAFAQAYLYDQINSFSEDSLETTKWLKSKIENLRRQSIEANVEIQKFREKNNLIQSRGGTVNEQQLANINERLGDAKAAVASARVKYFHSKDIVENKNISAAVAEAFGNDVIDGIRAQYLEDQQKLMELSRTLGGEHKTVKNLKNKLSESRNVIFLEMKRLSQNYKSEYDIALAEQKSLEKSLDGLVGVKLSDDSQSYELEALEKEAETYANLHEEYLEKYEVIQQQQSFPVAESRIITQATPPMDKSHPKSMLIIGLALIIGAGIGVLVALLKDNFDSSFKRAGQIENKMALHFLGFFPKFDKKNFGLSKSSDFIDNEYTQSIDVSLSVQAETCRNIKTTAQRNLNGTCKVIGMTSEKPNHGKSVIASNLALYIAQSGGKCLLVDADLRNPVLSEDNYTNVHKGLNSVLTKSATLDDAIIQDSKANLFVLPSETNNKNFDSNLMGMKNMQGLIDNCKKSFDYIIVDLPPLSVTSDASYSSVFVDSFLLALEWGKSKPNNLEFNLKLSQISKDKILGVVLGQANMEEMAKNYGHNTYPEYTQL